MRLPCYVGHWESAVKRCRALQHRPARGGKVVTSPEWQARARYSRPPAECNCDLGAGALTAERDAKLVRGRSHPSTEGGG